MKKPTAVLCWLAVAFLTLTPQLFATNCCITGIGTVSGIGSSSVNCAGADSNLSSILSSTANTDCVHQGFVRSCALGGVIITNHCYLSQGLIKSDGHESYGCILVVTGNCPS